MTGHHCPLCPQPGAQPEQQASDSDDDAVQATFQQLQKPLSSARPRLLQDMVQQLMLRRERLSLVTGPSGQGKTAFLVQPFRALAGRAKEAGYREHAHIQGGCVFCSRLL